MENSSSYRAKSVDRLVQPIGGVILIIYSLMMAPLPMEMRLFLLTIGAISIVLGVFHHYHKVFKFCEEFVEFKKSPISPSMQFRYTDIKSLERVGSSKVQFFHELGGKNKKHTLYIGMLSKDDRETLMAEFDGRISALSNKI
nr:hypothetical protein [Halomonas socia]